MLLYIILAIRDVFLQINNMTKYPTQYHINDNAMAARSSDDKGVYRIQQNVTKHQLPLTP